MKLVRMLLPPVGAMSALVLLGFSILPSGTLFADPNAYVGKDKGDWFVADNWDLKRVPTADDDVSILGKTVYAAGNISACSLHVAAGAALHLGSSSERMNVSATIEHDLVVEDQGKLYVYAGELEGFAGTPESYPDTFSDRARATAAIYANANVLSIGGDFIVQEGGTVYPDNAPLTGTPVFFKVEGDFELTADSSIDTIGRGWGYSPRAFADAPAGALPRYKEGTTIQDTVWTLAFGAGASYPTAGGYGGNAYGAKTRDTYRFGYAYGSAYAPFLSGSPAGAYTESLPRGSGSICVFSAGTATVAGTMVANGSSETYSKPSGGGIWLAAHTVTLEPTASFAAAGQNSTGQYYAPGAGGRISVLENLQDFDELDALAAVETLPSSHFANDASTLPADVSPGYRTVIPTDVAKPGTVTRVLNLTGYRVIRGVTVPEPLDVDGSTAVFPDTAYACGTVQEWTAPQYAFDPSEPGRRYTLSGWVISNAVGEVANGDTTVARYAVGADDGPLTLYWIYVNPEVRVDVTMAGGAVTVGGETYDRDFSVFVPSGADTTFTAANAGGFRFLSWNGALIPGGFTENAAVTIAPTDPTALTANFAAGAAKRVWKGPKNGALGDPANWTPEGALSSDDELYLSNATVSVIGGLTAGKLVVAGNSSVFFGATNIEGSVAFSDLYAAATVVKIAGAFEVSGAAKVTVSNDFITGTAVKFDVGSFRLTEGATVTATGKGWYWYPGDDDPRHVATTPTSLGTYQVQAPGRGSSYTIGGAYGGLAANAKGKTSGQPYGYAAAPFLPGSPNGVYNSALGNSGHPGGTVWVKSAGKAEIDGMLSADGMKAGSLGSASGGGIWVTAGEVVLGVHASLSAHGADSSGNSYSTGAGSGGRISIGVGLSDTEIDALARGEVPEGVTVLEGIDLAAPDVRAGLHLSGTDWGGAPGTLTTVYGVGVPLEVRGTPVRATGVEPAYGLYLLEPGEKTVLTAPEYGYDSDSDGIRYASAGYVVSNATGEVTSGPGQSVEIEAANGPMSVTWRWGDTQPQARICAVEHASLLLDGTPVAGDVRIWIEPGVRPVVTVVPEEGYEFVNWTGDIPLGDELDNPLTLALDGSAVIHPVVRLAEEPTERTWGGGKGVWTDPAAWTPAGNIPGRQDTVVIAKGTCSVSNVLVAASVMVSGGTLNVSPDARQSARVRLSGDLMASGGTVKFGVENLAGHVLAEIGGNLALSGAAKLYVYGGPVEGEWTHATGCSRVTVAGAITLDGTSAIYPVSAWYTGGSVVFRAGTVTVGETASFNANEAGYRWLDGSTPPLAPGLGADYNIGGGYGGKGGSGGTTFGKAYGFAAAPVEPGSPNGNFQANFGYCRKPGGLIRIHAKSISVAGTLTARSEQSQSFGGSSGGGIWLTADEFAFAPTAVLNVAGGDCSKSYDSMGGGGRIAIETSLTEEQIATLAETGTVTRRQKGEAEFLELFPGVTIDVRGGKKGEADATRAGSGTFVFIPKKMGLLLMVR